MKGIFRYDSADCLIAAPLSVFVKWEPQRMKTLSTIRGETEEDSECG